MIGANPAYDAPADLEMAARLKRAPFSVHLGLYADETAALCGWHVPESHPLESWSDLRATDGAASLVQPLIRPLYATRTAHELLAAFSGRFDAAPYALVRETWAATGGGEFETWWRQVLHDGVVAGSAAKPAVDRMTFGNERRRQLDDGARGSMRMTVPENPTALVPPHVTIAGLVEGTFHEGIAFGLRRVSDVHDADEARLDVVRPEMRRQVEEEILVVRDAVRKDADADEDGCLHAGHPVSGRFFRTLTFNVRRACGGRADDRQGVHGLRCSWPRRAIDFGQYVARETIVCPAFSRASWWESRCLARAGARAVPTCGGGSDAHRLVNGQCHTGCEQQRDAWNLQAEVGQFLNGDTADARDRTHSNPPGHIVLRLDQAPSDSASDESAREKPRHHHEQAPFDGELQVVVVGLLCVDAGSDCGYRIMTVP